MVSRKVKHHGSSLTLERLFPLLFSAYMAPLAYRPQLHCSWSTEESFTVFSFFEVDRFGCGFSSILSNANRFITQYWAYYIVLFGNFKITKLCNENENSRVGSQGQLKCQQASSSIGTSPSLEDLGVMIVLEA